MLLRRILSVLIACGMLGLAALAGPALAADDCKLPGTSTIAGLPDGRVGRPCITVATSPACVPYASFGYPQYGAACAHYVILYPFESGALPTTGEPGEDGFDPAIVWVETNGIPGLQSQGHPADRPILL